MSSDPLIPPAPAWLDALGAALQDCDQRAAAVLAGGGALTAQQTADLHALRACLECVWTSIYDPGVLAALAPDPVGSRQPAVGRDETDWRDLPRSLAGRQTNEQRSDLYHIATALDMTLPHLTNWLKQQFGDTITCVEQLSFELSEAAITLLGARLVDQQGGR